VVLAVAVRCALADRRNFHKVAKWTKEGQHIKEMLFAGDDLEKAKRIFERFIKKRAEVETYDQATKSVSREWPSSRD
jgi:hypothetical protein